MKAPYRQLTILPAALAALFFLAPTLRAAWPQQYGSSANDFGYGVATDTAGNVFTGGKTSGGILGQTSLGPDDGYVAKWDASGSLLWANLFGTADSDVVYGLARVGTGSVAAVGSTSGSLTGFSTAGGSDAMVRLYNANGSTAWTRQYGTNDFDELRAVAASSSYLYVAGYTTSGFGGLGTATNAGSTDAFVSQLDITTGVVNWTYQLGTSGADTAYGLGADALGNVYLAGSTAGALAGGGGTSGGTDAYVLKLNVSGALQWVRQFGSSGTDEARGLAVDGTGAVLVAGYTTGNIAGSSGGYDAFVRKYDAAGNVVWTSQFGTSSADLAFGLAVDGSNNVVVGGSTNGVLPGQTTPNTFADVFVRVLTPEGTAVLNNQFGGTSDVFTEGSVAVSPDGQVYLAGYTEGALPGQTSQGNYDAFVIQTIPEPGSAGLLALGALGFALRQRRVRSAV